MREILADHGLILKTPSSVGARNIHGVVAARHAAGLTAAERRTVRDIQRSMFIIPSRGGSQYQSRKLQRTRKDLIGLSKSAFPSRAIRKIRNAIGALSWGIQAKKSDETKGKEASFKKSIDIVKSVLNRPSSTDDDLSSFLGPFIEDMLIFDAGVWEYVEKPKNIYGNEILALELTPGFTIAQNAKWEGNPKQPRWLQILDDGSMHGAFLDRDLEYCMMRRRTFDPFGLSPLETAVEIMDSLVGVHSYQREIASSAYPSMLIYLGDEADEDQRKLFRIYWDNELKGRGTPGFIGGFGTKQSPQPIMLKPNNDDGLFLQYQEMLVRVLSICFDLHPLDFGLERDVNRSTAGAQMSATVLEAVRPYAQLIQLKFNTHVLPRIAEITGDKQIQQLEFFWTNIDPKDEKIQADIDSIYGNLDAITLDEIRANMNQEPFPLGLGKLTVTGFRNLIGTDPLILLKDKAAVEALLENESESQGEGGGEYPSFPFEEGGGNGNNRGGEPPAPTSTEENFPMAAAAKK